jgi:putative ABC transport system permease protein
MLKNYFITAFRSFRRNLSYTFLNVFGLTLSIACCLVIFLIVRNELGYDNFHRRADRTYRVTMNGLDFNPSVSMAITPAMRNDFPELEEVSQYWHHGDGMVKVGDTKYQEKNFAFADPAFLRIFDYDWLQGDPRTALTEPNTVVLTESYARKYFGDKSPIGQTFQLDKQYDLRVTGLVKDIPGNTSMPFNFLVSFETVKSDMKRAMEEFYAIAGGYTFIVLPEHYSVQQLQSRMPAFIEKNWGKDIAMETKLPLQPLREIHFDQRYLDQGATSTTSKSTYWGLGIVALFILVTACINFINMATAQATQRAKEVGVRKVMGANRWQLIRQFMGETSLLVLIATILGIAATIAFLPIAGSWLDVKVSARQLIDPSIIGLMTGITLLVILLAGLYPAFVQSAFQPIASLKGKARMSFQGLTLRKSLVLIQFAISQILIIGTIVVAHQMDFIQNQELGFNKAAVIAFPLPQDGKREVIRQQLLLNPGVKQISFSSAPPVYNQSFAPFKSPELGITKDDVTELKFVDEQYTDMFGLKMLAGEKIAKVNAGDTSRNAVVNETLVHKLNLKSAQEAVGHNVLIAGERYMITGVVQDFQSESKHKKIRPCILTYRERAFFMASVQIDMNNMRPTIASIEKGWSGLFPDDMFTYEFMDEHIAAMYKQEAKTYTAFKLFSSLAILIGCMGLYGLVAFAAMQRTKEVGIRKVLGASMMNIMALFAKEFIVLIIIAFCIAAPVAYYVMQQWLGNFAYQVHMGSVTFIVSIVVSFLIAGITIGYQSLKAALTNPLNSLRTE